jgi:hypothetical protein
MAKSMGDGLAGRFSFPLALLAFPLYLVRVSGLRVCGDVNVSGDVTVLLLHQLVPPGPSDFLLVSGNFSGFRCQGCHVRSLGLGNGYALIWGSLGAEGLSRSWRCSSHQA